MLIPFLLREELRRDSDWPHVENEPLASPEISTASTLPHTALNCRHPDHPDFIVDHFPEENELEEEEEGGEENDHDDEEHDVNDEGGDEKDRTDQRQGFGDVEDGQYDT